jgi:ABC-type branched-subunit amino acid transport system substrate-binding protein
VIRIKLKKENVNAVPIRSVPSASAAKKDSIPLFKTKESYKVALFLPFNLDSTETLNKGTTAAAWEYYMGARMAFDSLEKIGLKGEVFVYDYQSRNETIDQQLAKSELKKMDLIFAPFQAKEAEKVAIWSKMNKVRVVFPVSVQSSFLNENSYAYALTPTNEFLVQLLAENVYQTHENQQIILIKSEKQEDQILYNSFLKTFKEMPPKASRPRVIEATWSDYKKYEKLGSNIFFVFLSTEKEKVLTLLSSYANKENITLFGVKEWAEFKEINSEINNKFSFCYASPSYFSYKDPTIIPFHKQFRSKYGADLSKMACLGYDATMNIASYLLLGKKLNQGLISGYDFVQSEPKNGYQNKNGFILKFEEFESKKVEWKRK